MATIKELTSQLKKLGIEVPLKAKKVDLEKLLSEKVPDRISDKGEETTVKTTISEGEDYLQKYQYGRELPLGDPRTNPSLGGKAARMKGFLLKQPRVRIIIPREQGESPIVRLSVCLNGYRLDFPKQTYIEVPEQVAEVIMSSQHQTEEALQYMRVDRNEKTTEALS